MNTYIPPHFAETRPDVLQDLIRSYPLATLVGLTADGLVANHIPLELELLSREHRQAAKPNGDPVVLGVLRGHVARANPFWREYEPEVDVLAVFQGPQAYVSPSWYPTKQEHGRVVPTWNYAVVHARGQLRVFDDASWTRALVERLTSHHEAGRPAPWAVSDAPAEYVERLIGAIVGVEIHVTRLTGKWKTSANQPAENRAGVARGLAGAARDAERAMAALVAAHDLARER